MFGLEMRK